MFGRKRSQEPAISTLVGETTRLNGDIEFRGGCLVDGYVKGNVTATGDEDATLSLSEHGIIEGAVTVPNVLLHGTVKGDVTASKRIELRGSARVLGNLQYNLLEMAIGAEVNGKLIHAGEQLGRGEGGLSVASPVESEDMVVRSPPDGAGRRQDIGRYGAAERHESDPPFTSARSN